MKLRLLAVLLIVAGLATGTAFAQTQTMEKKGKRAATAKVEREEEKSKESKDGKDEKDSKDEKKVKEAKQKPDGKCQDKQCKDPYCPTHGKK